MPVLYASPERVVIYTNGDTTPETVFPPDLTRAKFDTELEYVRTIRESTVALVLPELSRQANGNQDPAYIQNHVLETHGLGYTPLVFGFATIAGVHVPLRGSVPIQISGASQYFSRCLSLGSSPTQVILNEYAVRNYFAVDAVAYDEVLVNVTYFITDEALDG